METGPVAVESVPTVVMLNVAGLVLGPREDPFAMTACFKVFPATK
jgi:hypothetical protein